MTLVLGIATADSMWLLADRRLTRGTKPYREDANKMLLLEASDGKALVAYSGLGESASGTEPSEWMVRVLRGRPNLTVDNAFGLLARAAEEQLPKYLNQWGHVIVGVAIVGGKTLVYSIEVGREPGQLRFGRRVNEWGGPPHLILAGLGGKFLAQTEAWQRDLRRRVKRCNRGKSSPFEVSDQLARLNYEASRAVNTVGSNCIVVWRFRDGRTPKGPGGGASRVFGY